MTPASIVTIICSALAVVFSGISIFMTSRRNHKKDDSKEATQMTTVIVKLENIGDAIGDVKNDLKDMRSEIQYSRERLLKCEQNIMYINSHLGLHLHVNPEE